jgi:hypothetical protein
MKPIDPKKKKKDRALLLNRLMIYSRESQKK